MISHADFNTLSLCLLVFKTYLLFADVFILWNYLVIDFQHPEHLKVTSVCSTHVHMLAHTRMGHNIVTYAYGRLI